MNVHSGSIKVKVAAFQIDINGIIHLVCVPTASFRAACDLESWLTEHLKQKCYVKFLGRYDRVQAITAFTDIKTLIEHDSTNENSETTMVSIGADKMHTSL